MFLMGTTGPIGRVDGGPKSLAIPPSVTLKEFHYLKFWTLRTFEHKIVCPSTTYISGYTYLEFHTDFRRISFWRERPQWARASLFTRFLDHTQRRTTVGRTPLDVAETPTWQHTTLTTEKHPCPQQASGPRPTP